MNFELLYKVERYLLSKKKIMIERKRDSKSQKYLVSLTRSFTPTLLKTVTTENDKIKSRNNSVDDYQNSDQSVNLLRNNSNLKRNLIENDIESKRSSRDNSSPYMNDIQVINENNINSKYQNIDDLKDTYHLSRKVLLLKRYLLDMQNGLNLYINTENNSFNGEDFPVEFNKTFKASFDKLYTLFINVNAPALLNIKEVTSNSIKEKISNNEYSYDMYMEVNNIYNNFYLCILLIIFIYVN